MSLRIISWNVNGFHSSGTRGLRKMVLRQELQPTLVGRIDVLLLHEHKLSTSQTRKCGKVHTGRSHTYWEPSIGEQGRSGGVCTSIGASLVQHVCGFGTLVPGRALWVGQNIEGSRIGILNIYAPTDLRWRAAFWSSLSGLLPKMDS